MEMQIELLKANLIEIGSRFQFQAGKNYEFELSGPLSLKSNYETLLLTIHQEIFCRTNTTEIL